MKPVHGRGAEPVIGKVDREAQTKTSSEGGVIKDTALILIVTLD